jgi:hypothetical protein
MGFEPTTPTLARLCSTTELHPRYGDNANRSLVYNPSRGAVQEAKCSPAPAFTQLFPTFYCCAVASLLPAAKTSCSRSAI